MHLSICWSTTVHIYPSIHSYICLSIYLSAYLSVYHVSTRVSHGSILCKCVMGALSSGGGSPAGPPFCMGSPAPPPSGWGSPVGSSPLDHLRVNPLNLQYR